MQETNWLKVLRVEIREDILLYAYRINSILMSLATCQLPSEFYTH